MECPECGSTALVQQIDWWCCLSCHKMFPTEEDDVIESELVVKK